MQKKYLSLTEAIYWIAFGKFSCTAKEIICNKNKIHNAYKILHEILPLNRIKVYGQSTIGSDIEQITDLEYTHLDTEFNSICVAASITYYAVNIDANDLKREFPNGKDQMSQHSTSRRPRCCLIHDIAYYAYETHKTVSAKILYRILTNTLEQYRNTNYTVTYNTIQKWLTDFKNGAYTPANTKRQTLDALPTVYNKISDCLRNASN